MGAIAERIPLFITGLTADQLEVFTEAQWAEWKELRRQYWLMDRDLRPADRRHWAATLAEQDLAVISSDAIEMRRVDDFPFLLTKVAVYRQGFRYGSIVNSGYMLKTISNRENAKGRCHHLELDDPAELCPDCGKLPGAEWISRRAINIIRPDIDPKMPWKESGLWRDKRHTKIPWNWQERDGGELSLESYLGERTNVRLTRTRCKIGELGLLPPRRRQLALDGKVVPEIDQRSLNAAWPYVLSNPDFYEYRAPYSKVREMRDAGFSIPQMAKRLKVSERTIDNRLIDVPDTLPAPHVLALRVKAGGGYMRPAFWAGADNIPRGYRHPWHLDRPLARLFPPVQRERTFAGMPKTWAVAKRKAEIDPDEYQRWLRTLTPAMGGR